MSNQYDKVIVSKEKLTAIAENIRTQTKTTNLVTLDEMATMQLGTDTSNATATSDDILLGKTAYANDTELVGTIETYDGSSENGEYYETNLALNMIKNSNFYAYLFYMRGDIAKLLENVEVEDRFLIGTSTSDDVQGGIKDLTFIDYLKGLFYSCKDVIKLPKMRLASVTIINYSGYVGEHYGKVFYNCTGLETLDVNFRTYYGAYLEESFYNCTNLKELTLGDIHIVGYLNQTFYNCSSLETINGTLYIENSNPHQSSFYNCFNLKNITFGCIKGNIQLGSGTTYGHLLTIESLLSACQACYKNRSTRTLTVGSANLAKLESVYVKITDETDTNYLPFEVCESTDEGAMLITDYMSEKGWTLA